jgi:hypothetical protein
MQKSRKEGEALFDCSVIGLVVFVRVLSGAPPSGIERGLPSSRRLLFSVTSSVFSWYLWGPEYGRLLAVLEHLAFGRLPLCLASVKDARP